MAGFSTIGAGQAGVSDELVKKINEYRDKLRDKMRVEGENNGLEKVEPPVQRVDLSSTC